MYIQLEILKNLVISPDVEQKLIRKHGVEIAEVRHCFYNRNGKLLLDNRALHKTNPPTLWFIAMTNKDRLLKIVYIQHGAAIHLRTAYEPNAEELAIYRRYGGAV